MTSRKDFLAATALLAAASPVVTDAAPGSPAPKPSASPDLPKLDFDITTFASQLDRDVAHRHLFAAKEMSDGLIFDQMRSTLHAYKDIAVPFSDVALAGVLYHQAMLLGLDDDMWMRYVHPAMKKMPRASFAKMQSDLAYASSVKGNPAMKNDPGDWNTSISSLVADSGARFYICDNATKGTATYFAQLLGLNKVAVYNDFKSHLIPNGMLVPAGVWAIHAVQMHKYTLLQSS